MLVRLISLLYMYNYNLHTYTVERGDKELFGHCTIVKQFTGILWYDPTNFKKFVKLMHGRMDLTNRLRFYSAIWPHCAASRFNSEMPFSWIWSKFKCCMPAISGTLTFLSLLLIMKKMYPKPGNEPGSSGRKARVITITLDGSWTSFDLLKVHTFKSY